MALTVSKYRLIDGLPLTFQGEVEDFDELYAITDPALGDYYTVVSVNTDYVWTAPSVEENDDESYTVTYPDPYVAEPEEAPNPTGELAARMDGWEILDVIVEIPSTESTSFSGTPTAPTAEVGTDTTQIATTAFVQAAIAKLISDYGLTLPENTTE